MMTSETNYEFKMGELVAAEAANEEVAPANTYPVPTIATPNNARRGVLRAQGPPSSPRDDDGGAPVAAIVVPILVLGLMVAVGAGVIFTVYRRRRFNEKRHRRFGNSHWFTAPQEASTNGKGPRPSLAAAPHLTPDDEEVYSLLPLQSLTPMHRSLSERSFLAAASVDQAHSRCHSLTPKDIPRSSLGEERRASLTPGYDARRGPLTPRNRVSCERSCSSLYKDDDALQGLNSTKVADTLFLDNDLYEGTRSTGDLSDTDGDYACPEEIMKVQSEAEGIYEVPDNDSELTDGDYEVPENGEDIYEVPDDLATTQDLHMPPRMPTPLSSDHTSDDGDTDQPMASVEYYTTPTCRHCGQGCARHGQADHGYDPVYVPRHDAEGMARRLDMGNYYRPRSESTVTSPYEEITMDTTYSEVQKATRSPGQIDGDGDLDADIPYATAEFIAHNNSMADTHSPDLPPRNKSMLDLVIPTSPQSSVDTDRRHWENTVPLRRPPPLVPRQRPQTMQGNSTANSKPPLLQPRVKSWTPKTRADSGNSDYEPYDFTLARQQQHV